MNDQRCHVNIYSAVPQELQERRQWVMWRWAKREDEDKPTKPPYKPTSRFLNRQKAKNNDPYTWTDFQSVCKPRLSDTPCFGVLPEDYDDRGTECGCVFSGIGYVFSEDDPYCGIDLDDCLYHDENGKIQIKPWAQSIVDMLTPIAYAEVSPSGKGIKFWIRGKLPPHAKNRTKIGDGQIEVYDSERYFTVTGRGKGIIQNGQNALDSIVSQYLTQPQNSNQTPSTNTSSTDSRTPDEIIDLIRKSPRVYKFDALMAGNTTGYDSQSEADFALCGIVAFWTQDLNLIDVIFRQSDLMRAKWDEPHYADGTTYGQKTIERSLSGNQDTYNPRRSAYHRAVRRAREHNRRRYF